MNGRFALFGSQPFLQEPDSPAGGDGTIAGSDPPNPGGTGETKAAVVFTPEQQRVFNEAVAREKREAREAAERKFRDEAAAAEQKRKDEAAAEAAKAAGKFDEVEGKLKGDLQTVTGERDSLKAENDRLREAMKSGIEARWGEVPEKVRKIYKGSEDDVLARWEFLHDADIADLVKTLAGETKETPRGNGAAPPRGGSTPVPDDKARQANSVRYG